MIAGYSDGSLMFCNAADDYKAENAVLDEPINAAATLELTLPYNNLGNRPAVKSSVVSIHRDGREIFRGSVVKTDEKNMGMQTTYTAESCLAWFRDVVIDPISASYTAPAFVLLLCEKYNLFAKDARRILCGNVDVAGAYNPQAEKPTTIWDYLSGMKEALGGYISVRYADGSVYVDYTVQSGVVSEQHIIKGLNLVSIRTTIESEEYCTRVYPIGSDGTLINSVNGNKPVLINAEAEKLMGCVVNRLIEVNSTDPETIKNAGQKILNECSELQPQLQVSAIDRSGIDPTLPPFLTGQWAIVEVPPADLETAVQIVEVKTDLLKPNNPQITLGSTPRKITTMLGGRK